MKTSHLSLLAFLASSSTSAAFVVPQTTTFATSLTTPNHHPHERTTTSTTSLAALPPFVDGAMTTASAATQSMTASPLFAYFLQTVISYAVPTFFALLTIWFAASSFGNNKDGGDDDFTSETAIAELYSDLYGNSKKSSRGGGFSLPSSRSNNQDKLRNLGIPSSQYIKMTSLNEKFDSYDFSLVAATQSKAVAAAQYRSKSFDRALQVAMTTGDSDTLPAYAKTQLLGAEKNFLKKGQKLVSEIQSLEGLLAKDTIDKELKRLGVETFEMDPEPMDAVIESKTNDNNETISDDPSSSSSSPERSSKSKSGLLQEVGKLQKKLKQLELDFIQDVVAAVGPQRAIGVRAALLGDIAARGSGGLLTQVRDRPLSAVMHGLGEPASENKSVFVMKFPGDVTASQLNGLREEVTAIVRNSKPGDEALVILQSGGGTVTGYGLAAGQLVRLREKGIFLTIAVEQVAASGGYMMTCVADRIVASPFAVLGSIGVISEIPNFYERLNKEGVEFQTVTAGKFKRTLTPTKKINKADLEKAKEDVEMILDQFSGFVKQNRPQLDIENVATGETWFGEAAMEKGLCDEIKTVDDVLLEFVDLAYNVYEVEYSPPKALPAGLAAFLPATSSNSDDSIGRKAIRWLVESVAAEVRSVAVGSDSADKRYLAKDDSADRMQMRD